MPHQYTHKHATVTPIFLLRAVVHGYVSQPLSQQLLELDRRAAPLAVVGVGHGVVVEGDAVDDGDEEERPVGAALGLRNVDGVVDG